MAFPGCWCREFWRQRARCVEAGVVMEEIGRTLMPSPFPVDAVLAVFRALARWQRGAKVRASAGLRTARLLAALPRRMKGKASARCTSNLQAVRSGNGFRLNGAKALVVDGHPPIS